MDSDALAIDCQPMPRVFAASILVSRIAATMLLVWIAMIGTACAQGQPVLLKHETDFNQPLSPFAAIYLDETQELSLNDVTQATFTPLGKRYIDFGLSDARIWVRVSLKNPGPTSGTWRLDLRRQFLHQLDAYIVRPNGEADELLHSTGNDKFNARPVKSRYLAADFSVSPGETVDLYVSYSTKASTSLPLRVLSAEAHALSLRSEDRTNWILNGALIAMLVFAILVGPVVGWKVSLSYCFYLISGGLFVLHSEGYAFELLWPDMPGIYDPLDLTLILMMSLAGPLFARFFFKTRTNVPWFDKILVAAIICSSTLALLSFPLFQYQTFKLLAYPFVVITSALYFAMGVIAYRRQLLGSRPFLLGSVLVLASLVFAFTAHARPGWISLETTLDVGHMTLLADAFCFAAAIVIRVLGVQRERDLALQAELDAAESRMRLERDLRKRERDFERARETSRRRKEQLASVRHDIRQPLLSLRSAMERVSQRDEQTTEQMHAAFDYLENLAHLSSGDRSEASAKRQDSYPLSEVLDRCYSMFVDEAANSNIKFTWRTLNDNIEVDQVVLLRIINNLVANAIRHSGASKILLAGRRINEVVAIELWDNGSGMSESDLQRYMQPAEKSSESTGAGLGLAIARNAAHVIGAELEIESRKGGGTRARLKITPKHA